MSALPTEIERVGGREIRIRWEDGHESVYRNPELRFACACANCVEEWSGVRRIQREAIPDDIFPTGMELVGNYAVQITWSDGHATGIYTYDALRQLCPCGECKARPS